MPEYLTEIGTWIAAKCSFTLGDDLQVHHRLQSAPDRVVLLTNNGGGKLYQTARERIDYMLQVLTRSRDFTEARDDAGTIHKFLFEDGTSHVELPTASPEFRIENIQPVGPPQPIGEDANRRFEYSTNYKLALWRF